MKKLLLILLITLLGTQLPASAAYVFDIVIDNLAYAILDDNSVSVAAKNKSISGAITIPSEISHNGVSYAVTQIYPEGFSDCKNLTSVTIGNSVTSIGDEAFGNCSSLTSVTIPNSVTTIEAEAFRECTGLTSVTIGDSVTSIEREAFLGCSGLTSLTMGDSVTSIGEAAFYDCSGLTSLTIPNSVTSIGEYAFERCHSLIHVIMGKSVTSIGRFAFDYAGLRVLTMEGNIPPEIEDSFSDKLLTIYIPAGTLSTYSRMWGEYKDCFIEGVPEKDTFIYIDGLVYTENPGGGAYAMAASEQCVKADIASSVTVNGKNLPITAIPVYAFEDCTELTSVKIPATVTTIGIRTFWECSALTEIKVMANEPPVCDKMKNEDGEYSCFDGVSKRNCVLYVPEGSVSAYEEAEGWKEFYQIVGMDFSGVEEVDADEEALTIGNGCITANADNTAVAVYTLDGRTLANCHLAAGESISLTSGLYIISVNGNIRKVYVK